MALAYLALGAACAAAALRYASPTGRDDADGTTPATAWSLDRANQSLVAGDRCQLLPGTYTETIAPAASGDETGRIVYVGDPADPSRVVVASFEIEQSFVTVSGVHSIDAASLDYPARNDSIVQCQIGGLYLNGAKHSMVARNRIAGLLALSSNGLRACFEHGKLDPDCIANSESDTLRSNSIDLGILGPGARAFRIRGFTRSCLIDSNRVSGVFDNRGSSAADAAGALSVFNSSGLTFRDNRWELEATSPRLVDPWVWDAMSLRDSTRECLFERDTMWLGVHSTAPIRVTLAASGDFSGSVASNRWTGCDYRVNGFIIIQDDFTDCVIENSVLASRDGWPLWIGAAWKSSVLRHNLLWSTGQALLVEGQFQADSNEISSNIFYSQETGPVGPYGGQARFGLLALENFRSDHNLFFTPTHGETSGDQSFVWCCYESSPPGPATPWFALTGQDEHSSYGSPALFDSSFITLDPKLAIGSAAIGAGEGGTDAGPKPYVPDLTAPAGVGGFSARVASGGVFLSWIAPGNDGVLGTATAYDLRRSSAPIDEANFLAASPLVAVAHPSPAGLVDQYRDADVAVGDACFYAIRVRDQAANWSPIALASPTSLLRAQPNPARETARIQLTLARRTTVELVVFDVGGRVVHDFGTTEFGPGLAAFQWDLAGGDVRSGIYWARARTDGTEFRQRIVVIR